MKYSVLVAVVILVTFFDAEAWWIKRRSRPSCTKRTSHGQEPYYFGTTDLSCMMKISKKGKRSAPSRYIHKWAHRFIYYRGVYFEFGVDEGYLAVYGTRARVSDRCSSRMESSPAGYSNISVDCLKKCTDRYKTRYGNYNFLTHNCHVFANRMSEILCNRNNCPSWCG